MDIALKLSLLDQIYCLFDDFAGTENVACKKQCASCCTCNMTLTTLEGYKIISLLDARAKSTLMQQVCDAAEQKRFKPQITTNRMARRCMTGQELPQDVIDPAWGSCPLLFEKECRIYSMRPFGCRCMMSKTNCAETGYADMDEFTLSVANSLQSVHRAPGSRRHERQPGGHHPVSERSAQPGSLSIRRNERTGRRIDPQHPHAGVDDTPGAPEADSTLADIFVRYENTRPSNSLYPLSKIDFETAPAS